MCPSSIKQSTAADAAAVPDAPVSAPVLVSSDTELASLMLRRSLETAGVSERQLAYVLGVSRSRVRAWLEVDSAATIPLHRMLVLASLLPTLFGVLCGELRAMADDRRGPGLRPSAHVGLLAVELGHVASCAAEAEADGTLDDGERKRLDKELQDVIARAESARRDLRGDR